MVDGGDPRGRLPSHRLSARRAWARCHGHLRVHPGLERVHHRLRAVELLVEANPPIWLRLSPRSTEPIGEASWPARP